MPVCSMISRAQVGLAHLQAQLALVLRHGPVHGVGEDQVGLAGLQAQLAGSSATARGRRPRARPRWSLGERRPNVRAVAHRLHELVGDRDAVVQVQRLAVEVAGGFADLEELLDLRVVDVEIDRRRAAAQRALADRQRQASPSRG